MNKHIPIFSLLLIASLSLQCGKLKLNPNQFYQSDFPIQLGNYWEYERIDSGSTIEVDTVIATITEEGIDLDKKNLWKIVWETKSGEFIHDRYVLFKNNKLTFYRRPIYDSDFIRIASQYKFPFKPEDDWEVNSDKLNEVYTVQENIENPDFGDAYSIKRKYSPDLGEKIEEDILICKDIGIIQRRISSIQGSRVNHQTTFRLLAYHIEE